jgi:TPR repeat protein
MRDEAAAHARFQRAAAAGLARAHNKIGFVFEHRLLGAAPDAAEAARWYQLAANGGCPDAMINIAVVR